MVTSTCTSSARVARASRAACSARERRPRPRRTVRGQVLRSKEHAGPRDHRRVRSFKYVMKNYMIYCVPAARVFCGSVPPGGPWVEGLSRHLAGNKDEFSTLLKDALAVKAASLLHRDDTIAHLCIRCMCSYDAEGGTDPPAHEGTATFVEVASSIWKVNQVTRRRSRPSCARPWRSPTGSLNHQGGGGPSVCSSALTYVLADSFCHAHCGSRAPAPRRPIWIATSAP